MPKSRYFQMLLTGLFCLAICACVQQQALHTVQTPAKVVGTPIFIQTPLNKPSHTLANTFVDTPTLASTPLHVNSCLSQQFQAEILNKINSLRAAGAVCGNRRFPPTKPLRWSVKLQQAADKHAQDMARHNFFDHKSASNGGDMTHRLRLVGYNYEFAAENIAAGQTSISQVVETWRKSPAHCETLMEAEFVDLGVACQVNTNSYFKSYWALNAATPLR